MRLTRIPAIVLCLIAVLSFGALASGQVTTTLFFDNSGAEFGITPPGTTTFSFAGSNWSGGVVATEFIPPLYASGQFSYEIGLGGGQVSFDTPVNSVNFFFVHGFGFGAGTATAFDSSNNSLGSVNSNPASFFGDPGNFFTIDPATPIDHVDFSGAVIDNFTFTTIPEPATCLLFAGGAWVLIRRRRPGLRP
ncbi:MAG: PEP-CTERM sorting domain-containing protein [Phycisphaerae bacterium]